MMFYYLIDPKIFTSDDLTPREKSYFKIYAESESISSMLYFDMSYFYGSNNGREINFWNFVIHYALNILLLTAIPLVPVYFTWLILSGATVAIMYMAQALGAGMQGGPVNTSF